MNVTETCPCGGMLSIDDADEARQTILSAHLNEFRQEHAACRGPQLTVAQQAATGWPLSDPDDVRVLHRRATIGMRADYDPYGDGHAVSDALRLHNVANYIDGINSARGVENRVPRDLHRIADELEGDTRVNPAAAVNTYRCRWPYTTPTTGLTYEAPTNVDELARVHADAVQCSMENCREDEHPPNPTWDMVGILFNELEALSRLVAETMAAGETGSEYHALNDLIGAVNGRGSGAIPADVGVEARTLRRIDELCRYAVERIEAERDRD